ncbi:MAG: histone acetyltransferase [candidate division SR1 bacterium CG_4_9_14_3_um_filter_40_9]|nr:MAG: histone acetyltransferase [candidate division SR1 bacterium CG_4_9_14_3_um_filter_40_9]
MEYIVKELMKKDLEYLDSFFVTLSNLTDAPKQTREKTENLLMGINEQGSKIFIAITTEGEIIGALTLMVEQKMIRGGAKAGHIEDVVTREGFEGNGIGKALMNTAIEEAKNCGCYKIILDCDNELTGYYKKFGFKTDGAFMRMYL